jgi:phage FluMu protein Com
MRCPDCNKFVAYGEGEVEITDVSVNDDEVSGSVRIMLPCGDCGTELKDAEIDFNISIDHECAEGTAPMDEDSVDERYEIESESADFTERMQDKDRHGKQIKSYRYMRHFYGAEVHVEVKCNVCGESFSVSDTVEEMASGFNELV